MTSEPPRAGPRSSGRADHDGLGAHGSGLEATALLAVRALHFRLSGLLLGAVTTVLVTLFVLTTLRGLHRRRGDLVAGAPERRTHPGAPVTVTLLLVALCAGAGTLLVLDGPR